MNAFESAAHRAYTPAPAPFAAVLDNPQDGGVMAGVLMRMLDEVDYGVLLVTADGALRYANQLALRSLGGHLALRLCAGTVSATRLADQALLRAALNEAARGLRRLLCLQEGGVGTSVAVLPIPADEPGAMRLAPTEPLVMLVLGKQPINRNLTLDFFARAHGLTDAERNVLQGLCDGLRPKDIARQAGVKISTVRTQIGSVRIKTQTVSIRDVVDKVASLPPITPAVKTMVCH